MSSGEGAGTSTEDSDSEGGEIVEKSVKELVRSIRKAPNGSYAFFIGAGASYPDPANIPLAGDLIGEFQEELFEEIGPDTGDVDNWAEEYEEENREGYQNEYGFWFSEAYPVPGARREKIRETVEKTEPPFGQIILASMMDDGIIDHTLTPNFDDLLFDAFYNFTDERPLYIDHEAKAPRLNMSSDDAAIVKLHGDYLHYTQNTTDETASLRENIRERFEQSLHEYGLIVVGYGGNDEAIMEVLERDSFCEHGLFWCAYGEPSEDVKSLLKESKNAYLVDIDGSDSLFYELWDGIDEVKLPQPDEIEERAENQIETIETRKNEIEGREDTDEDSSPGRLWKANHLITEGEYGNAIDIIDEVIREEEYRASAYFYRGYAKQMSGRLEDAVEDYSRAIELRDDYLEAYNNRGNVKMRLGQLEDAIEDHTEAINIAPEDHEVYYNRGAAKERLSKYEDAIEDYTNALDIKPDYKMALNQRGVTKSKAGRFEDAERDFRDLISMDPEYESARYNLIESLIMSGSYDEAIQRTEDLLSTTDDDSSRVVLIMLLFLAKVLDGRDTAELEDEYRELCDEDLDPEWDFERLIIGSRPRSYKTQQRTDFERLSICYVRCRVIDWLKNALRIRQNYRGDVVISFLNEGRFLHY